MDFLDYDTRLAAYAVIGDDQGRILLTWWNGEGTPERAGWSLPGGGVDYEESLTEAVVREVREETGYDARLTSMLGARTFVPRTRAGSRDPRPFKSAAVLFEAEVTGGTLGTLEVDGSTEFAAWLPLADVLPPDAGDLTDHTSEGPYRARDGVPVMSTTGYALRLWAGRR